MPVFTNKGILVFMTSKNDCILYNRIIDLYFIYCNLSTGLYLYASNFIK